MQPSLPQPTGGAVNPLFGGSVTPDPASVVDRFGFKGRDADEYAPCEDSPFRVKPLGDEITAIEEKIDFWNSTPEMQYIAYCAYKRNVGRWALLGCLIVNALSWLPPHFVMSDRDGTCSTVQSAGSLNFTFHGIGESNKGKSRVLSLANEILPPNVERPGSNSAEPSPDLLSGGTGEGLIKHFVHQGALTEPGPDGKDITVKGMVQTADTAVVNVDEVSTYLAELARPGSKTAGIQASLWSGQMCGSNTGGADSRTRLAKHAARAVITMLAQPGLCHELFTPDLIAGGTPQRPWWAPVADWTPNPVSSPPQSIVGIRSPIDTARFMTPPVSLFRVGDLPRFTTSPETKDLYWIKRPPAADVYIAAEDAFNKRLALSPAQSVTLTEEERAQHKADNLQGHMTLTRLKLMCGIALLNGRLQPTDQDWELAGCASRVSLGMLSYLHEESRIQRRERALEKGEDRGNEMLGANKVLEDEVERTLERRSKRIFAKLCENGPTRDGGMLSWMSGKARDTREINKALSYLESQGKVRMCQDSSGRTTGHWAAVVNGNIIDPKGMHQ